MTEAYRVGMLIGSFFGGGLVYLIMTCWYRDRMKYLDQLVKERYTESEYHSIKTHPKGPLYDWANDEVRPN